MGRAFVMVIVLAACSSPWRGGVGTECEVNSECEAPLVCRIGYCRNECGSTRDCPAPTACVLDESGLGACQLEGELECALATDCPSPLVCRSRRCVNECANDRDCPSGARCVETSEGSACVEDGTSACALHGECAGELICGTDQRCHIECFTDRDCRHGTRCIDPDGNGLSACLRPCTSDAECGGLRCSPTGACRPACTSASDCRRLDFQCAMAGGGLGTCEPLAFPPDAGVMDGGSGDSGMIDAGVDAGGSACTPSVVSIAAGENTTCAVSMSGSVWCWGDNLYRELGATTPSTRPNPTPVSVDGITDAVSVTAGHQHFCALLADGRARCWGQNQTRVLGDAAAPQAPSPPVEPTGLMARTIEAGESNTCALDLTGAAYCWGLGQYGALGDGMTGIHYALAPQLVPGLPTALDWIVVGERNSFAFDGATLFVWGYNSRGELGTTTLATTLSPATPMTINPMQLDSAYDHTCAIDAGGRLWCWGRDDYGQLGDGTIAAPDTQPTPQIVPGIGTVTAVRTGGQYTCVIEGTTVRCWGVNFSATLGNGGTTDLAAASLSTPVIGLPAGMPIAELTLGYMHACARIGTPGVVYCWGSNFAGALGLDALTSQMPSAVPAPCVP